MPELAPVDHSPRQPRRRRLALLIATALLALVGGSAFVVAGRRAFDPPDRVSVRLRGLPKGAQYWCLIEEQHGRFSPVTWYDPGDGPGSWYERAPKGNEWYGRPDMTQPAGIYPSIKFSRFERLGVLWRANEREWRWFWFPGASPERQEVSWLFGNGWIGLDIPEGAAGEVVPSEKIALLGLVP